MKFFQKDNLVAAGIVRAACCAGGKGLVEDLFITFFILLVLI